MIWRPAWLSTSIHKYVGIRSSLHPPPSPYFPVRLSRRAPITRCIDNLGASAYLWIEVLGVVLTLLPGAALSAGTEVLSESGISVTFEQTGDASQIGEFKKNILPEVKNILSDLTRDLGDMPSNSNVKIFFYSPETYHAKFPRTIATRIPAFYSREGIQARADNDVDYSLKTTLRHELTHLIVDTHYGRVPAWMNEGLAVYEERLISVDPAPHNIDYNTLVIAKQDGKYLSLETLDSQSYFGRDHGTVASGLAYTIAYVAVYELKQKSGMDTIRSYLKSVGAGKNPRAQFESAFGMSYAAFNDFLLKTSGEKS